MGWWRRSSRLISDAFRCYNPPKIVLQPRNAIVSRRFFSSIPKSKISEYQSQFKNLFADVANRSYSFAHKYRDYEIIIVVVSGVVITTVYFKNLETVPYTKRTHFVLLSNSLEKTLGETVFKHLKTRYKDKLLPPVHPDSIRVQRITNDIIDGLKRGLTKENVWSDIRYSPDKIIDEQGKEKQGIKSHVEGMEWEVIVVDDPMINAGCLPGGKIVVFTGLLNVFTQDAEVAAIIGHEVGHAVARHSAERISRLLWWLILQLVLCLRFDLHPDGVGSMSKFFIELPFSRRMEMEADYIGVMLMASAGYDPRVGPQVFEKLGKVVGDSELNNYISTHPSSKKRAQKLSEAKVMEEALNIYREVQAGREVETFL